MVYDAADATVLLYEIAPGSGCATPGIWSFSDGAWTGLPSASAPRFDTVVMAYDAHDGYVVLFGGCGTDSNQTWTFSGGTWTNLTSTVAPPSREAESMAYDAGLDAVVLFGGYVYTNAATGAGERANDTWTFQGGIWRNVTTSGAPPSRDLTAMASDSTTGGTVLFGGEGESGGLGDTWAYNTGVWSNETTSTGPSSRAEAALSDDPAAQGVVLFGGLAASSSLPSALLNDTWRYSGGVWQKVTVGASPPAREGADLVYDPSIGELVLFGGAGSSGLLNDTWVLNATLGPAASGGASPTNDWIVVALIGGAVLIVVVAVVTAKRLRAHRPPNSGVPP